MLPEGVFTRSRLSKCQPGPRPEVGGSTVCLPLAHEHVALQGKKRRLDELSGNLLSRWPHAVRRLQLDASCSLPDPRGAGARQYPAWKPGVPSLDASCPCGSARAFDEHCRSCEDRKRAVGRAWLSGRRLHWLASVVPVGRLIGWLILWATEVI